MFPICCSPGPRAWTLVGSPMALDTFTIKGLLSISCPANSTFTWWGAGIHLSGCLTDHFHHKWIKPAIAVIHDSISLPLPQTHRNNRIISPHNMVKTPSKWLVIFSYFVKALHFWQINHRVGSVLVIVGDHSGLLNRQKLSAISYSI